MSIFPWLKSQEVRGRFDKNMGKSWRRKSSCVLAVEKEFVEVGLLHTEYNLGWRWNERVGRPGMARHGPDDDQRS